MRLTSAQDQALMASLTALKQQQRALARSMEEVKMLLESLEAADDAEVQNESEDEAGPLHYGRRQDHTASA